MSSMVPRAIQSGVSAWDISKEIAMLQHRCSLRLDYDSVLALSAAKLIFPLISSLPTGQIRGATSDDVSLFRTPRRSGRASVRQTAWQGNRSPREALPVPGRPGAYCREHSHRERDRRPASLKRRGTTLLTKRTSFLIDAKESMRVASIDS